MADRLDIEVTGEGDLLRWLHGVAEAATNARPLMKMMGAYLLGESKEAFQETKSPETGAKWPPLAEKTLKSKHLGRVRSSQAGGRPLFRAGMMMASVTELDLQAQTVSVGSRLPHALLHNSPPVSARRRFPQRQFLGFPPETNETMAELLARHLEAGARK